MSDKFENEGGDGTEESKKKEVEEVVENVDVPEGSKVSVMPAGEYTIHVLIQSLRNLILFEEDLCNPMVYVYMLDGVAQTTDKSNIARNTMVKYDEHLFLEIKNKTKDELQQAIIKIEVMNKGFFRNDMIGEFTIPASTIYNMKDHTLRDQLVGISNLNDNSGQRTTGTVALSINVKGPDDPAQELKMASEATLNAKPPLTPASIKKVYKQLYMRVLLAESLPNMDEGIFSSSTTDAYVKVKHGSTVLKTKIVATTKEGDCKWFEEMQIPIELPLTQDYIQIEVWDYDFPDKDDLIASVRFNVDSALRFDTTNQQASRDEESKRSSESQIEEKDDYNVDLHMLEWINLYGGPVGHENAVYNYMNQNPDAASHWAGRILIEYWSHDTKFPRMKKQKCDETVCNYNIDRSLQNREFFITGQMMSAINLPDKKDYKIKLQIGNKSWTSPAPVQTEQNYARWNFQFEENWQDNISMLEKFPDMFVYLLDDDVPICYYRDSIARFTQEENTPLEWLFFKVDQAVDYVKDLHKAGCFSLRLYIRDVSEHGRINLKTLPNWKRGMPRRNNAYKLRVAIYQCQSLPPADSEGTSDPYVKIWSSDPSSIVQTSINYDTNNPIYYELKQTNIELPPALEDAPPIQLEVYDSDEGVLESDDFLGRANIFLKDLAEEDLSRGDRIPKPSWYPIKFSATDSWDEKNGARILCSFCLLDFDMKPAIPADQIELDRSFPIGNDPAGNPVPYPMPDLNLLEFQCEINVLGLRQLKPEGILPINKAFVKFKLKSMLKNEQARAVKDIQTLPTDKGSNPNIKKTLTFEMRLPSIALYVPRMTCEVFDNLYFDGLPQPQIGSFMLDMGKAREDGVQKDEETAVILSNLITLMRTARAQIAQSHKKNRPGEFKRFAAILDDVEKELKENEDIVYPELIKLEQDKIGENFKFNSHDQQLQKAAEAKKKFAEARERKEMKDYEHHHGLRSVDSEEEARQKKREDNRSKRHLEMKQRIRALTIKKSVEENDRKNAQKAIQDTVDGHNFLIYPKYQYDQRLAVDVEYDKPSELLFIPIGYNKTSKDKNKHYRRFYNKELEEAQDLSGVRLVTSPFLQQPIHRTLPKPKSSGTGAAGWFKGLVGGAAAPEELGADTLVEVGHLKARLSVYNKQLKAVRDEKVARCLAELKQEIEDCYNLESVNWSGSGSDQQKFPSDLWNAIDPDRGVTYSEIKDGIATLQNFVIQAGLGQLRLEQVIGQLVSEAYLQKALKSAINCRARIYILDAFQVEKRDLFSESDPYLIVRCGQIEFNDRDNFKLDTANPVFNQSFEFMVEFPGSPALEVEIWDYDEFFGDELVGATLIDLDDRYFSRSWQAIDDKPVEYRELKHFSSSRSQGTLKCWVEIDEQNSKRFNEPKLDINSEPRQLYEARVVVWKTENLDEMDFEGCSDAYFKCYFDADKDQQTDVHYRCQNGKASFNWRMKFELDNNQTDHNLTVQGWDRDLIASDDLIGAFQIPISIMFRDVHLTNRSFHLSQKYWKDYMKQQMVLEGNGDVADKIEFDSTDNSEEKFWVPLSRYDSTLKQTKEAGKVLISVYILPKELADKQPLGTGRENVNSEPYCPEPEGRIEFSINPFTMLGQLIPEKFRRKIYCIICSIFCIILVIYMAPMIISNGLSKLMFG